MLGTVDGSGFSVDCVDERFADVVKGSLDLVVGETVLVAEMQVEIPHI